MSENDGKKDRAHTSVSEVMCLTSLSVFCVSLNSLKKARVIRSLYEGNVKAPDCPGD